MLVAGGADQRDARAVVLALASWRESPDVAAALPAAERVQVRAVDAIVVHEVEVLAVNSEPVLCHLEDRIRRAGRSDERE
jgi:hypothetical protein